MEKTTNALKDAIKIMEQLEALDLDYTVKRDRRVRTDYSGESEVETHYYIRYGGKD